MANETTGIGAPTAPTGATGAADAGATALSAIGGTLKGISGIVEGIFQIVGKLTEMIVESSPMLQGVLKILDKMFKLVLMPIGNLIGRLLLPIAIKMAQKTMAFLTKYGNVGPDQLGDALTEGLTIAIQSIIDVLSVVLTKVLWPVLSALGQSIINGIAYVFGLAEKPAEPGFGDLGTQLGLKDISNNLNKSFGVAGSVINTFGMTIQTGNKMIGTGFSDSAMIIYKGGSDIANGFQSNMQVWQIGTTKMLKKLDAELNVANAGLVITIDTLKIPFQNLIDYLNTIIPTLPPPTGQTTSTTPAPEKKGGWEWWQWALAMTNPVPTIGYMLATGEPLGGQRMAEGGIVSRPTTAMIGEAGPEAVVPLNRSSDYTAQPDIHVHFHGDVYGMNDFEKQVEKAVGKYTARVKRAY